MPNAHAPQKSNEKKNKTEISMSQQLLYFLKEFGQSEMTPVGAAISSTLALAWLLKWHCRLTQSVAVICFQAARSYAQNITPEKRSGDLVSPLSGAWKEHMHLKPTNSLAQVQNNWSDYILFIHTHRSFSGVGITKGRDDKVSARAHNNNPLPSFQEANRRLMRATDIILFKLE